MGLLGIFTFGLVAGAWLLTFTSSPTGLVITSDGIDFTETFSMENLTSSIEPFSKTESILISNNDGVRDAIVTYDVNITDYVFDTCDNTDDIEVIIEYEGVPINSGDTITILSGETSINATTNVVAHACPQRSEVIVTIGE